MATSREAVGVAAQKTLHAARPARRLALAAVLVGLFLMHGLGMGHQPATAHPMERISVAMGATTHLGGPAAVMATGVMADSDVPGPGQPQPPMDMSGGALCLAVLSFVCAGWLAVAVLLARDRRRREGDVWKVQGAVPAGLGERWTPPHPPSLLALCVSRT